MHYCKSGNLLVVKPCIGEKYEKFCRQHDGTVCTTAWKTGTHEQIHIPEDDIVMALEASVPPFYWSDMIRCLWNEVAVHIRRVDLQHLDKPCPKAE
jgi:hypothetical protein